MNPWLIVGLGLVWLASLWGAGSWQRGEGRTTERVAWQERENKALAEANVEIKRLTDEARATEHRRVAEMTTLAVNYDKGFRDAETRRRRDVDASRAGALVLRIPASACAADGGEARPPGAAAAGGDGSEGVELPRAIAADLLDLAYDADQVADQLRACQAIVTNDRKESP
jgi:hypothetical protein